MARMYLLVLLLGTGSIFIEPYFPALAMGLYILYGQSQKRQHRSILDFADSVYYLGFTFTLISLAIGIYRLDEPSIGELNIVDLFGTAVITSIIGIIWRSLLLQFYKPSTELEDEVTNEVANKADELLNNLEKVNQVILEDLKILPEYMKQSVDELNKIMEGVVANTSAQFESAFEPSLENLKNSFKASSEKISSQFSESIVDVLVSAEEDLKESTESLISSIEGNLKGLKGLSERQNNAVEAFYTKLSQEVIPIPEQFESGIQSITNDIQRSLTSVKNLSGNILSIIDSVSNTYIKISENSNIINAATNEMPKAIVGYQQSIDSITSSNKEFQEEILKLNNQMISLTQSINNLQSVVPTIEGINTSIRNLFSELDSALASKLDGNQ